jgi:putative copper export protein
VLFTLLVTLHALAATVWTGGHLVLALGVLPRALRQGKADPIRAFEEPFEPLGLAALALQVITGLWMTQLYLPGWQGLFSFGGDTPIATLLTIKLLLLAATVALALDARLRLIPRLRDDHLAPLAWHIGGVTVLSVAFVVAGAGIRLGGWS